MSWNTKEFQEKLDDQHTFPGIYTFKFIVPSSSVNLVEELWKNGEVKLTPSSKGKYTSVTIRAQVESSEDIIGVYQEASSIKGCIAL